MKMIRRDQNGQQTNVLPVRDVMNRLLEESFWDPISFFPASSRSMLAPLMPSVDISETDQEIMMEIDVPGYDPENINVDIDHEKVAVSGKMTAESEEKNKKYYRKERTSGEFYRELSLPNYADSEKARCKIKNGILTITVPKKKEATKRALKVEAA